MASSYFEVALSPCKKRDSDAGDDIPVLDFRPFASIPKIIFKNVAVGDSVSKCIILKNPHREIIEVELSKIPDESVGLRFSEKEILLHPYQETTLRVDWQPKKEGKCIHSVHLKTNTNSRHHFSIVCVSVQKKPLKRNGKSTLGKPTFKKNLPIKNPNSKSVKKNDNIINKAQPTRKSSVDLTKNEVIFANEGPTQRKDKISSKSCIIASTPSYKTKDVTKHVAANESSEDHGNCSSETYDLVSPEPRNLSTEMHEKFTKPSAAPPVPSSCWKTGSSFLSDFNFSPILPSISSNPAQKRSRETYSVVPTVSYLSHAGGTVNCMKNTNIPENLDISDDSLSPISPIEKNIITHPAVKESALESDLKYRKLFEESFSLATIQENCADLDISHLSEIEGLLAERLCENEKVINDLELSVPFTSSLKKKRIDVSVAPEDMSRDITPSCFHSVETKVEEHFNASHSHSLQMTPFTKEILTESINYSSHQHKFVGEHSRLCAQDLTEIEFLNFSTQLEKSSVPDKLSYNHVCQEESKFNFSMEQCYGLKDPRAVFNDVSVEMTPLFDKSMCNSQSSLPCNFGNTPGISGGKTDKNVLYFSPPCHKFVSQMNSSQKSSATPEFMKKKVFPDLQRISELRSSNVFQSKCDQMVSSNLVENSKCEKQKAENVCLTISPPHPKVRKQTKENVSPKTSCKPKNSLKPSKQFTPLSGRKAIHHVLRESQVKREPSYPISKIVLSSKKRKKVQKEVILMDTDKVLNEQSNPSYCITSTFINPFLNGAVYYDQQWFDAREKEFVRWLNVLLTPPEQLSSSNELPKVDVADLWKRSCKADVAPAPSRETVSSLYLVNHRLDSLRRKACVMFSSPSVAQVLSKVVVQIDKGILSIRKDRNIVRDIGLKCTAVKLLLCYNPLWLRIGLETIMGRTIVLESNSDIVGITGFIARNVLSDPYLVQQYAYSGVTNMFKPGYEEAVKKHILKKFFMLVFFLDYAKKHQLIVHNPCLFCRDAQYKESRDILLAFARDFLAGIGDVTKHLKCLGYTVQHKQTYLDEYDYAVKHLGSDLRDGVRLTRVTEIILQEPSLSTTLRTPAISKLQKLHNVKVALQALCKAGHTLEGDISTKDIVEGHKEKTMSLLWQIIYRFQLTRFTSAATKIQLWFRSLSVCIQRKIWLRKDAARRSIVVNKASTIIQKYWRRYITQKRFKAYVQSIYKIQVWFKSVIAMKTVRSDYVLKRDAAIKIQRFVRAVYLRENIRRNEKARDAAKKISAWYGSICHGRRERNYYRKMKCASLVIQRWYRATQLMHKLRDEFILKRNSALIIQKWYKGLMLVRRERKLFLEQKRAVLSIQHIFRAHALMKQQKQLYEMKKNAALKIQVWYRACCTMRIQRREYLRLHNTVIKIQCLIRRNKNVKIAMREFQAQKCSAKKIQMWYRAVTLMKQEQKKYYLLKRSCLVVQRKFRAKKLSHLNKCQFDLVKKSAIIIQRWFRGYLLMLEERKLFNTIKKAACVIQMRWRAMVLAKKQRNLYVLKRNATTKIQKWFKSRKLQNEIRAHQRKKMAVKTIQCWYRRTLLSRQEKATFQKINVSARKIQCWFRATILMKRQRKLYLKQKHSAIIIQRKFRGYLLGKKERQNYCLYRKSVVSLQIWFRNLQMMKQQRQKYMRQKNAIIALQQWWRTSILAKNERRLFLLQKNAACTIKVWYRSCCAMKKQRLEYLKLKESTSIIQSYYRSKKWVKDFQAKRRAASTIQLWYRAILLGRQEKNHYDNIHISVIRIQVWFRACNSMKEQRNIYLSQKKSALMIQSKYRAWHLGQQQRECFNLLRLSSVKIQRWYRRVCITRKQRNDFKAKKRAVLIIQERFRACLEGKKEKEIYIKKRYAVLKIQSWFRTIMKRRKMNLARDSLCLRMYEEGYLKKRKEAIKVIELWYYSLLQARLKMMEQKQQEIYVREKSAIKIQACWRGYQVRKLHKESEIGLKIKLDKKHVLNKELCLEAMYSKGIRNFSITVSYAMIMSSALCIESCVRLSCELCEKFIKSQNIDTLVYLLIQSNRSVPAEKLLAVLVEILAHILRHKEGLNYILKNENFVPTLLTLTNVWCAQKSEKLFCYFCTVWWLLAQDENVAQSLKKEKNICVQLWKCYKKVKAWSIKHSRSSDTIHRKLPVLTPSWAAGRRDRPYMFENSLFAITQVFKELNIASHTDA